MMVCRMGFEDNVTKEDLRTISKLGEIVALLHKPDVLAVDLSKFHIKFNNKIIIEFFSHFKDLDVIGDEVRKVNRVEELKRMIETKVLDIDKAKKDIKFLEGLIKYREEELDKLQISLAYEETINSEKESFVK